MSPDRLTCGVGAGKRHWIRTTACVATTIFFGQASIVAAILFSNIFNYPNGLITNEKLNSPRSPDFIMNSGSLFATNGVGWTGVPDTGDPGRDSLKTNNSCIFRLNTIRSDFENFGLTVAIFNRGYTSTPKTPPVDYDGIHIWVRFLNESNHYAISVNRRDNDVIIKKKIPGGPSNGGTYTNLTAEIPCPVQFNTWQLIRVTVQDQPATGFVILKAYINDKPILEAVDDGTRGGPPLKGRTQVGLRGDNTDFMFDNLTVFEVPPTLLPAAIPTLTSVEITTSSIVIEWPAFTGELSQFYKAEVFSTSEPVSFVSTPLNALRGPASGINRAQIKDLLPGKTYEIFLYHAMDFRTWSLPSKPILIQTVN